MLPLEVLMYLLGSCFPALKISREFLNLSSTWRWNRNESPHPFDLFASIVYPVIAMPNSKTGIQLENDSCFHDGRSNILVLRWQHIRWQIRPVYLVRMQKKANCMKQPCLSFHLFRINIHFYEVQKHPEPFAGGCVWGDGRKLITSRDELASISWSLDTNICLTSWEAASLIPMSSFADVKNLVSQYKYDRCYHLWNPCSLQKSSRFKPISLSTRSH